MRKMIVKPAVHVQQSANQCLATDKLLSRPRRASQTWRARFKSLLESFKALAAKWRLNPI